jgi:hypothetical protein
MAQTVPQPAVYANGYGVSETAVYANGLSVLWDGWFWSLLSSSRAVDFPYQILLKKINSKFLFSVLL